MWIFPFLFIYIFIPSNAIHNEVNMFPVKPGSNVFRDPGCLQFFKP